MSQTTCLTLTNGVAGADLSVFDRGLAYGDGLFETCRVIGGRVPLWPRHRARLERGAEHLNIPLDVSRLEVERRRLLSEAGAVDGVLKLIVTRGSGGRAYRPPGRPNPSYCWQLHIGAGRPGSESETGVTLFECRHRLGDNPALAGLKHLNRLEYVMARAEWNDEFPEGLLRDQGGRIVEGTLSNVFVRTPAGWVTPALERNGVAGVMRGLLLEVLAPSCGFPVLETTVDDEPLLEAREMLVCNSVFGIWPVTGLSGGARFPIGEQTRALQRAWSDWQDRH